MARNIAILAGSGQLPQEIARACPGALFVTFAGIKDINIPKGAHFTAHFERFGALFDALRENSIRDVVFAGALSRPDLNPALLDDVTTELLPRISAAFGQGDDGLLREIITIFEENGFRVIGANDAVPNLVGARAMSRGNPISDEQGADIARGFDVLAALSPLDVAQAVVVEHGQVLGVETLQGTDAMLGFVARTPAHLRKGGGVFVKTAKLGQELRIDMPVIGPQTVQAVSDAGLGGIVIEAGRVMVLEQARSFALIDALGLFLVVQ